MQHRSMTCSRMIQDSGLSRLTDRSGDQLFQNSLFHGKETIGHSSNGSVEVCIGELQNVGAKCRDPVQKMPLKKVLLLLKTGRNLRPMPVSKGTLCLAA